MPSPLLVPSLTPPPAAQAVALHAGTGGGRTSRNQGRNASRAIRARLDMGARIAEAIARAVDRQYGFWRRVAEEEFGLAYTPQVAKRLHRAYKEWCLHTECGRYSWVAGGSHMRDSRKRDCRVSVPLKMPCLGFELLQWFVDEIMSLQNRADSTILMDHARGLRDRLLAMGVDAAALPKIDKHWLRRWRLRYGISYRAITTRFKVSWAKAVHRVSVMLGNIFRLRKLWDLCHPGVPMRWLSLDQKPSWFNNAGLKGTYTKRGARNVATKTDHNATRQRYTILTFVQSWPSSPEEPPKCAVLFKGAPNGRLNLQPTPGWLKIQTQEKGSYRAQDVVCALDWSLPAADTPQQSIVVLLDWFSAHLSEEVREAIRSKGHVLLLHGGGVTALEQVNDTHLHAQVQRRMEELETREAYNQRRTNPGRIARLTRQGVIDLVREMWLSLDHVSIAKKGYEQTGPMLPDDVGLDACFKDLQPFWSAADGNAIRSTAYNHVQALWDAKAVTSWAQADVLIEHHTPHPPVDEGLEGILWDVDDREEPPSDPDSEDCDGDVAEARCPGLPSGSGGEAEQQPGALGEPGSEPADNSCAWGGICDDPKFAEALQTVAEVAKQTRDDKLLRMIRDRQRLTQSKRAAMDTPIAQELRRAAQEDRDRELTRRTEILELERRARLEDAAAKEQLACAQREAAKARTESLQAARRLRAEEQQSRLQDQRARAYDRWLQTMFPLELANRLLEWRRGLSDEAEQELRDYVHRLSRTSRCTRSCTMPVLWEPSPALTSTVGHTTGRDGARHPARCGRDFEWLLFRNGWASGCPNGPAYMMLKLLDRVVPQASALFASRYTVQIMLASTHHVLEQTFVFAIILLSKWLGAARFPHGVHSWPPVKPEGSA